MGMKMTIEKAKEILKAYDFAFTGHTGSLKDAIDTVLPVVEKYQKIEQIMDELNGDFYGSYLKDRQALEKIYEVIEDGNDNN